MTDPIFLKDFFMWAIFKLIIEFVTILLLFYVLIFFFFFGLKARGVLAPWSRIEPTPALEGKVPTIGPPERSPVPFFYMMRDW